MPCRLGTAFLVFACVLMPCSGGASPAKVLRVHLPQDFSGLDWSKGSHLISRPVLNNIQQGLFRLNDRNELMPALAESWRLSDDHRTYRVKLRKGMRWSDGIPLVAQHFVDAWRRVLDPMTASPSYSLFTAVVGAEEFRAAPQGGFEQVGIRALSDTELEIVLKASSPTWIYHLTSCPSFPIRVDLISKLGNSWTKPGNLVNVGPFSLVSHEYGQKIVLSRNREYHPWASGSIDQVEFRIGSPEEGLKLFDEHKVDIVLFPSVQARREYGNRPELKRTPALRVKRISFRTAQYPISVLDVRKAIAQAIDRDQLAKSLAGHPIGARTLVPPGVAGYRRDGGLAPSQAEARAALRRAFGTRFPRISMLVPSFDENTDENLETANFLRMALKNVGIELDITYAATAQEWLILADSTRFGVLLHDWTPDFPHPAAYYSQYAKGTLKTSWSDPAYNGLLSRMTSEEDGRSRDALLMKLDDRLLREEVIAVPLFYAPGAYLAQQSLGQRPLDLASFQFQKMGTIGP